MNETLTREVIFAILTGRANLKFDLMHNQAAHCNQKTPIPVSSRWQMSEKAKKIITNNQHY